DDLLGALGDPAATGKPAGDDLRDGKATVLLAIASDRAGAAGQRLLAKVGAAAITEADVGALQSLLIEPGAVDAVEAEIASLVGQAEAALDRCDLPGPAHDELVGLCHLAAWRER